MRLEQPALKLIVSLSFTSNLAIVGTVPSCAYKLWMMRQTTHLSKSFLSVIHLGTLCFLPGVP
jgi:hypothetical protein